MPVEWMPWRRSAIRLVRAFYDVIAVTVAYVLFVIWVLDGFNLGNAHHFNAGWPCRYVFAR